MHLARALSALALAPLLAVGACSDPPETYRDAAPVTSATSDPSTAAAAPGVASPAGPPEDFDPNTRDYAEIRAMLERRAAAVNDGDRAGFLSTVDDADRDFVRAQKAFFANLQDLRVSDLSYALEPTAYEPADVAGNDPVLRLDVTEHATVPGVDTLPVGNSVGYTFVRRAGRWLIGAEQFAEDRGSFGDAQSRPWAPGRIAVATRGDLTVVVQASDRRRLQPLTDAVDEALVAVADLLERPPSADLLVDATATGTVSMINEVGAGAEAAATMFPVFATDPSGTTRQGLAGWRVKINPALVQDLIGDEHVMRHELSHFVLRGTPLPLWLSEGLAEYVGWHPLGVAELEVSDAVYDDLRTGVSQTELPSSATFSTFPEVNYLAALALVSELIDQGGIAQVLDLVAAYDGHTGADRGDSHTPTALRDVFDLSPAQLASAAYDRLMTIQH